MICIKGGTVIDGRGKVLPGTDVYIEDDRIVKVGGTLDADENIDAVGKYVMPGFVDMHCHLREPGYEYKEDIESGTRAAAAGGFTSVACMPNTEPVLDSAASIRYVRERAAAVGHTRVYPIGAVTMGQKGEALTQMHELRAAGAVALSDDGHPVMSAGIMRRAMEYASHTGLLIISHCEEKSLAAGGQMHEGYMSTVLGLRGIPAAAEETMVAREILLAEELGLRVHIAHVSTRGSIELIRHAKERGVAVTCETCPHYFSADHTWVAGYDARTKVNPPLRTPEDVEAVKEGLSDGTIDAIATDHAPHHRDEKEIEYELALNGISAFETAFALGVTNLVRTGGFSLEQLVEKMAADPAQILGLDAGYLKEGGPADLIIADVDREWTVNAEAFYSKGKNTPFDGKTLTGRVLRTIVGGRTVHLLEETN